MTKTRKYRCRHCRQVVTRKSNKVWIKSWCDSTEQYVRLMRLDKAAKEPKRSI